MVLLTSVSLEDGAKDDGVSSISLLIYSFDLVHQYELSDVELSSWRQLFPQQRLIAKQLGGLKVTAFLSYGFGSLPS